MLLREILLLLIMLIGLGEQVFCQETSESNGIEVKFEGNDKTKSTFLESRIIAPQASDLSTQYLDLNVQRLKNIPGIGDADYRLDTLGNKISITYLIREIRTALPIANFGGLKDNLWFQIGYTDINWRGRGQTLLAYYQNNDKRHSGQVYYRVPFIRSSNWGYSLNAHKWSSEEPLFFPSATVNYYYDNNGISISGLRQFGQNRILELGGTAFREAYRKSDRQFVEDTPGPENLSQWKYLSKVDLNNDFINYDAFYLSGFALRTTFQNVYNTLDKTFFNSLLIKGRKYIRTTNASNIAMRFVFGVSTNNDTPFAPFVVDSHVNLRGVGNRIERGTAQVVLNIEYRQTITHLKLWATQIVVFSDLGSWRNPGGKLEDILDKDQFRHFVGAGFRLIYKKIYGATLRIDYGVDIYNSNQRGFVLGLGQYF